MTAAPSAADISHILAERIEDLCRDHFPDGRFDGEWFHAEGWQGNPFLTVHVNLKTGRWHVTERRWVSPAPEALQ